MALLIKWIVWSVAVWLTAKIVPGIRIQKFSDTFKVSAIYGILNFLFGKVLLILFSILTLGLAWILSFITRLVINAILLKATDEMTSRFEISGVGSTLGAAFLISVFGTFGEFIMTVFGLL